MDGLDEYKDNPLRWVIGLLEETAQVNGVDLSKELATVYLEDNFEFITAAFEEEGIAVPNLANLSKNVQDSIE